MCIAVVFCIASSLTVIPSGHRKLMTDHKFHDDHDGTYIANYMMKTKLILVG